MIPDNNTVIYPENETIGAKYLNYFKFLTTSYIDSIPSFESRILWIELLNLHKN
jgi:hypothetical protein